MTGKADRVGQVLQQRIGRVLTLAHPEQELLPDELHLARVERRLHEAGGEDRPRAVERRPCCPNTEDGPIGFGVGDDPRPQARHGAAQAILGVRPGPAFSRFQQQRLDPGVLPRHLAHAAEQVQVGDRDVARCLPLDHAHAAGHVGHRAGIRRGGARRRTPCCLAPRDIRRGREREHAERQENAPVRRPTRRQLRRAFADVVSHSHRPLHFSPLQSPHCTILGSRSLSLRSIRFLDSGSIRTPTMLGLPTMYRRAYDCTSASVCFAMPSIYPM